MPVVDASVVVDWVAPDADPHGPALRALRRLTEEDQPVLAPRLLLEEVSNALLTGIRGGRWSGVEADEAFGDLMAMPVSLVDSAVDFERAWDLSRRYDEHPIYDMVYLAVALRLGESLLTADAGLADKVRLSAVVQID